MNAAAQAEAGIHTDSIDWGVGPTALQTRGRDREIIALAWPAIVSASIDPVLSLVDTYWVSAGLGTVSLAALGAALNVEDWLFEILKTIQVPVRSLMAQAAAKGQGRKATECMAKAVCLGWRVGLAVAVLGSVAVPWLLRLSAVGPSSPLAAPAASYLVPRLLGTPALLTLIVLQAALSGAFQDTKSVLCLVLLGAAVNTVLTPIFIFGLGAGTAGAAWATTISCFVSAFAAWRMAVRRRIPGGGSLLPPPRFLAARAVGVRREPADGDSWGPLLKANAAMSVRTFASITTWLVAGAMVTRNGVVPLAAHTCMVKTWLFFLFLLYGFQLAAQVLVSADVSRGDLRRGRWTALRAVRLGVIVAAISAAVLYFGAGVLPRALSITDPAVIAAFGEMAAPAALMVLLYGALWVSDGVMYGLGEYLWMAKLSAGASLAAVVAMLMFGSTAPRVWWSLAAMTVIRLVGVLRRVFYDRRSPISGRSHT